MMCRRSEPRRGQAVSGWMVLAVALGASMLAGCEAVEAIARAVRLVLTVAATAAVALYALATIAWVVMAARAWSCRDRRAANAAMVVSTLALLGHVLGAMLYSSSGLEASYGVVVWGALIVSLLGVIGCVGVRQFVDAEAEDESD